MSHTLKTPKNKQKSLRLSKSGRNPYLRKKEMSSSVEDNVYRYNLLTGHYLGLFPLWSGNFHGNMPESKKTTWTNSTRHKNHGYKQPWWMLVWDFEKFDITTKKKMRSADFICTLPSSLPGTHDWTWSVSLIQMLKSKKRKQQSYPLHFW